MQIKDEELREISQRLSDFFTRKGVKRDDVDDLVQKTFWRVLKPRDKVYKEEIRNLQAIFYAMANHVFKDYLRIQKRKRTRFTEVSGEPDDAREAHYQMPSRPSPMSSAMPSFGRPVFVLDKLNALDPEEIQKLFLDEEYLFLKAYLESPGKQWRKLANELNQADWKHVKRTCLSAMRKLADWEYKQQDVHTIDSNQTTLLSLLGRDAALELLMEAERADIILPRGGVTKREVDVLTARAKHPGLNWTELAEMLDMRPQAAMKAQADALKKLLPLVFIFRKTFLGGEAVIRIAYEQWIMDIQHTPLAKEKRQVFYHWVFGGNFRFRPRSWFQVLQASCYEVIGNLPDALDTHKLLH